MLKYILLFFAAVILFGCNDDDLTGVELNSGAFYPLQKGMFWIYSTERTDYLINGTVEDTYYQTKVTVRDSSITNEEVIYSLIIEQRSTESEDWEHIATWESYKNNYIAVLNTGSLPKVKLTFPISQGIEWNSNSLNALPEDIQYYDSINRVFSVEEKEFSTTITVVIDNQDDPENITQDNIEYEIYAKDTGLIYFKDIELFYKSCSTTKYPECCEANVNICFNEIVEGHILKQKLLEFGVE
ncbi:MAG: hypothetical protein ACNS60_07790 [Candidatus Cyclobacteriaceae bacterium M2_1C_046]